jgi:ATP-dependent exoDNAse (exonuclease V) alpha subunit
MALYSLHAGFVSRSSGRSSVQAAAYICGEILREDRRDKVADYRNRVADVTLVGTLAPEHSKYQDLSVWNAVENFEDESAEKHYKDEIARNNYKESAQTAQTIIVALPNEFSLQTNQELVEKFIKTRFLVRGLITTYAIHNAEGNLHAHLQITRRAIGKDGEFENRKDREIVSRSALIETRKLWADLTNEFLAREGIREQITEKSFKDLGVDLEPTRHRGWYGDKLEFNSRIVRENVEIFKENEESILQNPGIILDLLNATKAVFSEKDILREAQKRIGTEKLALIVFEKALEKAVFVGENLKGEFLYTGEKYKKMESATLSRFEELAQKPAEIINQKKVISKVLGKYNYFAEEQKKAVIGLSGCNNIGILIGRAGAGKTTTMRAMAEIYQQSGARVIGMSLSAVASENLGNDAKIESKTIASWTHEWRIYNEAEKEFLSFESIVTESVLKQFEWYSNLQRYEASQLKSGDVILVDEAGMVGTSEWNEILAAAEKFGAKIIAVGDENQFSAISAGNCFEHFAKILDGLPHKNIFRL